MNTTATETRAPASIRAQLETLLPHCIIRHGYVLVGAGPARHGWSATTAAGCGRYLGRGSAAVEAARELGQSWGAC